MVSVWDTPTTADEAAETAWPDGAHLLGACLAALRPAFFAGDVVAEIGAGVGRLTIPFADEFPNTTIVALEPSDAMARWMPERPNVYRVSEGWELPPDLDGAYSMVTFQHVAPEVQHDYVRLIADRLVSGGVFCFQWQTHGDVAPLAHPVPTMEMGAWVRAAGLVTQRVTFGFEAWDPPPPWGWITAVKP